MTRRSTRSDDAAAGLFAFVAFTLIGAALLIASTSFAPAQTLVFPSGGNTDGTITTSQGNAVGNPHTDANWKRDASGWMNSNANSSLQQGIPGQSTQPSTLSATTFGGVKK